MQSSPFKFLDSYTLSDRDIFFGREAEIEEVYSRKISYPDKDRIFIERMEKNQTKFKIRNNAQFNIW